MEFTIVCFIGDYAICKNEKTEEVFNISRKEINDFKEGDKVISSNGIYVNVDERNNKNWDKYYVCDDILIEIIE